MAFTKVAVFAAMIFGALLFVVGTVLIVVMRKDPKKGKWGWVMILLSLCAITSAIVNAYGVFY